jgi:arylsulfatase A-like enzyme
MIAQIDDQLERILDCLEETRQRDNTVIILTSDHGEMLGDHGLLYKGCRYYEGLVRVPLIFSWKKIPGNFTTFGSIRTMPASRPSWLMPALTPPCWPQ